MKAIIMAGGEGTRLRPLTCGMPKPLAKLCGRPVIFYILDLLDRHGFDQAVFTLGYKGGQIESLFESGRYKNINLKFSREDTPLGTAGCVKHAANGFKDDFLVISGDALCDFDLSAVADYHKSRRSKVTVITKCVDDPREYGLVLSDGGRITGFSEKPSYLGCVSDCANTGVYVLSPSVLGIIPDSTQSDFARDIFPKMLKSEMPLHSYEESGYWCDIGDFSTYAKSQRDILTGRVKCEIAGEKIAEGVYTSSKIPGTASVKAPCYIGANVSLGEGCLIEGCVIGDSVSVGSGAKLRGSVILDGAYISDNATVNEAVVCRNTKLLYGSCAFEGSVIGEDCIIGREAVIGGGVKIWSEKEVPAGVNVRRDIKYGSKPCMELSERGVIGETNADITPELCARLGAALTCVSPRVAVSCESGNASVAMKYAIISGITASGGEVFDMGTAAKPQLLYGSELLNCGVSARVKCGVFAEVEIFGGYGLPLTRPDERKVEAALSRSEYKTVGWDGFGGVTAFGGSEAVYASMLKRYAAFNSNYKIKLNCNNADLSRLVAPVLDGVSRKDGEILIVTLTGGGAAAEFFTEKNIKIEYDRLLMLAAVGVMKDGFDVALPNDFAACSDFLAESYGRRIYRYYRCPNDASDAKARLLAARQPFLRDGAILALNVLRLLSESGLSIEDALKSIPDFAVERRELEINCPPQRIISRLCKDNSGMGEGVIINSGKENILLRSSKKGNSLFLFAESLSSETAKELCDNAEKLIKEFMDRENP